MSFDLDKDISRPLTLAATVEGSAALGSEEMKEAKSSKTRLVVFGHSEFASNAFVGSLGNGELFLNAVNWLAEEGKHFAIEPKPPTRRQVYLTQP